MQTYIVKKGDTLYGISNQFGVSVTELAKMNQVDANTLQIGQVLQIPSSSGSNPDNMFYYMVLKGDTLYSIAKKYNTSVAEIMDLNYFTNPNLAVGQIIRIPEKYTPLDEITLPQYQNYVVQKGDTIYSIASKFQINKDLLKKDNSLIDDVLIIGQNLKIRTNSQEVEECFGEDFESPIINDNQYYTVKKGDSLYSISKMYNTSVSNLIDLNQLTSTNLSIGQVLMVPSSTIEYIVQKGDTLYSIAKRYNTTVDSIIKSNNLSSPNLRIGQKLIIGGY